jgi:hypothetical protein
MRASIPATLVAGIALVGAHAAPARAEGDFERGFRTEMGRIVAHQVAAAATFAFFAGPPFFRPPPRPAKVVVERRHFHPRGCAHPRLQRLGVRGHRRPVAGHRGRGGPHPRPGGPGGHGRGPRRR